MNIGEVHIIEFGDFIDGAIIGIILDTYRRQITVIIVWHFPGLMPAQTKGGGPLL